MSRITPLVKKYKGTSVANEDPDNITLDVIEALSDTVEVIPEPGNYYTFIYAAKTPNITYDTFPLIAAFDYHPSGFYGFNFHWNRMRNYTFQEIVGQVYKVNSDELDDLKRLSYQKFVLNN